MYIIKKIFNNNVIYAEDSNQREFVFMGKGIGFSQSAGNNVDPNKIEKKFQLETQDQAILFGNLLVDVKLDYFATIEQVVALVKDSLDTRVNDYVYFSLSDHISFAIERAGKGIYFRNPLQYEIQRSYPKEYGLAQQAITIINQNLDVSLPPEEASFIALHIINGMNDHSELHSVFEELELIQEIIRIVKFHFKIELEENTINFERFMTHLKFFIHRLRDDKQLTSKNNELFKRAVKDWPQVFDATNKIVSHIYISKNKIVSDEEMFYLMLHINRLIERDEN